MEQKLKRSNWKNEWINKYLKIGLKPQNWRKWNDTYLSKLNKKIFELKKEGAKQ